MKNAFTNANGILTAWGATKFNNDDTAMEVEDDFSLEPGRWQLSAGAWIPYTIPATVPTTCTRKQGNLALFYLGFLNEVEAVIATASRNVQIAYNDATTFERTDPFLQMLVSDLGLTSAQLDQLFILAASH